MDFKEILVESYRKKEKDGRYEFSTGKNTKVVVNPSHTDLTTYQYDPNAKRKKKKDKDEGKKLMESFDVFKRMIGKIAADTVYQAVQKTPNMSPEKYDELRAQTNQQLKSLTTDQIVTQYSNLKGEPTVVQKAQQDNQDDQDQQPEDPNHSTNYVINRL